VTNVLLDSHVVQWWWSAEPDRLSPQASRTIAGTDGRRRRRSGTGDMDGPGGMSIGVSADAANLFHLRDRLGQVGFRHV
jgi:hypothetical protein